MTTVRSWRLIILAIGLLVMPFVLHAQEASRLLGAEEIITRANTMATKKDYTGAASLLKSALDRYPAYLPLYLALADLQEAAGIEKLSEPEDPTPTPMILDANGNPIPGTGIAPGGIQGAITPGAWPGAMNPGAPQGGTNPMGGNPGFTFTPGGGQQPFVAQPGQMMPPTVPPGDPQNPTMTPGIGPDGNLLPGWIMGPDGVPMRKPRVIATRAQFMKDPDLVQDIFETFGQGMLYLRDATQIRQRVNELIALNFPPQLGRFGTLALPGSPMPFSFTLSDPRLPSSERGLRQGLLTMQPLAVSDSLQRDPKYGKDPKFSRDPVFAGMSFQRMLYAYAFDESDQAWHLRFRIMWQAVPSGDDARLAIAQQAGQLLVRLYSTVRAYTGLASRFDDNGVVNVWLTEKGEAGGEAYNENIYIYNVGTPRTGMEWVREFAHEYGHQTLPIIGGYTKPEWAANGLLAERLFMRWLVLNRDFTDDPNPWIRAIDAQSLQEQRIFPLISKFANVGPTAPALRGTDADAMDTFIGMALYLEAVRGSRYLAGVLKEVRTPSYAGTNGFLQKLEDLEIYAQEYPTVLMRLRDLPQDIPYRAFLRNGTWQCELQGNDLQPAKLKLTVDGNPIPISVQGKFTLSDITAGWHTLRFTPVADAQLPDLTLLKLTRDPEQQQ